MARTTSFVLGPDLEEFVQEQVQSGEFDSASEVIREALVLFASEHRKEQALLAALDHGVASGLARPGVFARVRRKHGIK